MKIKYLHQHLITRHLQLERYNHVSVDDEEEVVTFPLWNLSGQMVGYQQYRPWGTKSNTTREEGKYFPLITPGQIGVWGVETLCYRRDILFVCEGIFDICRVHNLELPGVAVLGNNPYHAASWFKALGRTIIVIPDDDKPGEDLIKFGDRHLSLSKYLPPIKKGSADLGRLTDDQVHNLLAIYL